MLSSEDEFRLLDSLKTQKKNTGEETSPQTAAQPQVPDQSEPTPLQLDFEISIPFDEVFEHLMTLGKPYGLNEYSDFIGYALVRAFDLKCTLYNAYFRESDEPGQCDFYLAIEDRKAKKLVESICDFAPNAAKLVETNCTLRDKDNPKTQLKGNAQMQLIRISNALLIHEALFEKMSESLRCLSESKEESSTFKMYQDISKYQGSPTRDYDLEDDLQRLTGQDHEFTEPYDGNKGVAIAEWYCETGVIGALSQLLECNTKLRELKDSHLILDNCATRGGMIQVLFKSKESVNEFKTAVEMLLSKKSTYY